MVVSEEEIGWEDWLALRPLLAKVLGRQCKDDNELDDIIQETYLRAALYGRLAPSGKALRSWLVRIGINALADHRARTVRYQCAAGEGLGPDQWHSEEEELDGERDLRIGRYTMGLEAGRGLLRRTLLAVEGSDRRILDSVYGKGHSTRVTARCCEIPERLVKGRVYRARRRLCRAMRHRAAVEHGV